MSDNKDKDTAEPSVEFDFDSTVELDLDKLGIVSSPPTDKPSLDADFDETLNGLMEIDELLNEEVAPISEPGLQEQEPSSDSLDFDDVETGIEELLEPDGEAEEYMPEMTEKHEESDDIFDLDISDLPDEDAGDKNELLAGSSAQPTEEQPLSGSPNNKEPQPVVELTKEMLDEPEETYDQTIKDMADDFLSSHENDLLSEVVNEFAEKNAGTGKTVTDDAGMPELTTTETNIISDATAAIGDVGEYVNEYDEEEDDDLPEIDVTATIPPKPETRSEEALGRYVKKSPPLAGRGGPNAIPLLFAVLGIAAGGFGAWVAFDATEKVATLERQIQSMARTGSSPQSQDITDIQQRLAKVERRLSGMPTLEAAAPLGVESAMVPSEPVKEPAMQPAAPLNADSPVVNSRPEPVKEPARQPTPITPQTPIAPASSIGDWVVNVSSHANRELAISENVRLKAQGLNPEVHTAVIRGRTWYRVQVTGFASKDEAKASLKDLQQRLGIQGAWIGKR